MNWTQVKKSESGNSMGVTGGKWCVLVDGFHNMTTPSSELVKQSKPLQEPNTSVTYGVFLSMGSITKRLRPKLDKQLDDKQIKPLQKPQTLTPSSVLFNGGRKRGRTRGDSNFKLKQIHQSTLKMSSSDGIVVGDEVDVESTVDEVDELWDDDYSSDDDKYVLPPPIEFPTEEVKQAKKVLRQCLRLDYG
ncbi:hypothetical protein L1049_009831 [Liquidambar formosana]|uniref:Uncharacterized protein n=1 Tax=Liquidambar formosana TaxID=63359 RepID=A0AAP0R6H4_LIQFO